MVSVRRVAPFLLLVIATTAFAQKQSSQPPRDLHRVGDHWTAYNPPDPSTYPADARTHEIKAGDTLWALAQQYYNNAYLWPQLWESNTWITDAHWIYPGDVLLVGGEGTAADAATGSSTSDPQGALSAVSPRTATVEGGTLFTVTSPEDGIPVARILPESNPVPLATEADLYCYGYIGDPDEPMPNYVESFEDVTVKYLNKNDSVVNGDGAPGDLLYVHGGPDTGLVAGETYIAVQPSDIIKHPVTGEVVGRRYEYVGQIRILCSEGERSRAIVMTACKEIYIGARLKPIPQLPIPIARIPQMAAWCDPPSGRTSGHIIDSRGWIMGLAEGALVQVNLGRDDQIEPGDFLTVFRPSPRSDQPRMVLGQIGVLTTEARTLTGVILYSRREMFIGDQVELR